MYAEGFDKGDYEIETNLVSTDAGGKETTYPLNVVAPQFPADVGKSALVELEFSAVKRLRADTSSAAKVSEGGQASSSGVRTILFRGRGRIDVPVYRLADLKAGDHASGPAILEEDYFTCRVLEGWTFVISDAGDIMLNRKA